MSRPTLVMNVYEDVHPKDFDGTEPTTKHVAQINARIVPKTGREQLSGGDQMVETHDVMIETRYNEDITTLCHIVGPKGERLDIKAMDFDYHSRAWWWKIACVRHK